MLTDGTRAASLRPRPDAARAGGQAPAPSTVCPPDRTPRPPPTTAPAERGEAEFAGVEGEAEGPFSGRDGALLARPEVDEATDGGPAPGAAWGPSLDLDEPLGRLRLPTRMTNWAVRHGIKTVRHLLAERPDRLLREPNLGKTTIEETRRQIERHLGRPWESFAPAPPPAPPGGAPGANVAWDDLREFVPAEALDTPLERLTLPTRVLSFAARRSLATIGELLAVPFEVVRAERNLGRSSLDAVRDVVMGVWGDGPAAHAGPAVGAGGGAPGPSPLGPLDVWPNVFGVGPPPARGPAVGAPARGPDGAGPVDEGEAAARGGEGETPTDRVEGETPADDYDRAWARHLEGLSATHRQVVSARAGLAGPPSTLARVGAELGITRARARQIEGAALRRLRAQRERLRGLEARLERACPPGASVALAELEAHPFWAGVAAKPEALRYLLGHVLASPIHCFEFGGVYYLARRPADEVAAAWQALCEALDALPYPVELERVEALAGERAREFGGALGEAFRRRVRDELHVAPGRGGEPQSTAFGSSRARTAVALLRASPGPMRAADLYARVGPGALPDEVLFLGWGVVGLEQHVPDFRAWTARVVPAAVAVMREGGEPERQWSTAELIGPVRRKVELPPWLDHWHLASMLRVSGTVRYLGRLRVALDAGGENRRRLFIRDVLEAVLDEAGRALPQAELVRRARARAAMSPLAVCVTLRLPPFVRLADGRWGLTYRDGPGRQQGPAAPPLTLRSPTSSSPGEAPLPPADVVPR
jgi:hypothetical protein